MAQKVIKRKNKTKSRTVPQKGLAARVAEVANRAPRNEVPRFRAGDTVRVQVKIVEGDKERLQAFEGLVIGLKNRGTTRGFTVRKMSHGVGVERVFLFNSPKLGSVEVVQPGKVRRSKLYYIRELQGRAAKIERDLSAESEAAAAVAAAKA